MKRGFALLLLVVAGLVSALLLLFPSCGSDNSSPSSPANTTSSSWSEVGGGANGIVYALGVYNGELVAGGAFSRVGGVDANLVASWNGSRWSPLAEGLTFLGTGFAYVGQLFVLDDQLVVGGNFTRAGTVETRGIAAWDGTSWSGFGSEISGDGQALIEFNGALTVCAEFPGPNQTKRPYVASWSGTSWTKMGSPLNAHQLIEFDGMLYAASSTWINGTQTILPGLWRWTGTSWTEDDLTGGESIDPQAMVIYDNELVIFDGGANGVESDILAWNGSHLREFGEQRFAPVNLFAVFQSNLYAAGGFDLTWSLDDQGRPHIQCADRAVEWTGSVWYPLGSPGCACGLGGTCNGALSPVFTAAGYDGSLYVGGNFSEIYGADADNIVRYRPE